MLREIGDLLETITSTDPLLLVFEDLQWVDHSTVDLISALAPRRTPAKLMLIATKRPMYMVFPEHPLKALKEDLLVHELSQEIALEPLGEAEVAEYLGAGLDPSLPQGLAKLIYDHSEGNPLFIVVALDHMTERGLISRENGAWKLQVPLEEIALGVPQKLRRMIETQIDRLTPDEQRALEAASVAGIAFATEVCAAAANLGLEAFEDLCQGWRAGITSSIRLGRSNFRRGMSVRATNSSMRFTARCFIAGRRQGAAQGCTGALPSAWRRCLQSVRAKWRPSLLITSKKGWTGPTPSSTCSFRPKRRAVVMPQGKLQPFCSMLSN